MGWKRWGAAALLSASLWTGALAAENSVEMLREMFRLPVTEWKQTLKSNSRLLNEEFFTNVGKRIRWGIENNHVDDAFRFAMVGDFGAEAVNKPANYRIDLAELFYKAQNYPMAGQIVDNIGITSPDSASAPKAKFIGAQIKEAQKDLYGAYAMYVELAEKRYLPEETWYRAGLISLYVGEVKLAKEQFTKSGSPVALEHRDRILREEEGGWDSVPPVPNSPTDNTMPNTATVSSNPMSSENPEYPNLNPTSSSPTSSSPTASTAGDPLSKARMAVADNRLVDALEIYAEVFDPKDAKVALEYGAVLYRMGDLEQAKSIYDKALAKNSKDVELLRGRANTLERMYDRKGSRDVLKAALTDYRQATALAPDHQLLPWELTRAQAKN
jgi:tetratricopeptide (TPR) repeat protein